MRPQRRTVRRVYVKVTSDFDSTGYMQPRSITWVDGRTFPIEAVRISVRLRPWSMAGRTGTRWSSTARCGTSSLKRPASALSARWGAGSWSRPVLGEACL